jgi:hypothetical protein
MSPTPHEAPYSVSMSVPWSGPRSGDASRPRPGRDPRRARRALGAAGAVFVLAAGWAAVSASGLVTGLGRDAVTLSQELDAARYRAQPAFKEKVTGARDAAAAAGWGLGPAPPLPTFDCWQQADTTACDLFAHADGEAPTPAAPAQRAAEINRLVAGTNAELARGGWACDAPRNHTGHPAVVTDCTQGTAELRVSLKTGVPSGPALHPETAGARVVLRLDLSDRAYRSTT